MLLISPQINCVAGPVVVECAVQPSLCTGYCGQLSSDSTQDKTCTVYCCSYYPVLYCAMLSTSYLVVRDPPWSCHALQALLSQLSGLTMAGSPPQCAQAL